MTLPPPPPVPSDREGLLTAVESTLDAIRVLAGTITEEQSLLPTPCDGWTVRDQVAHVVGLEARILGRPGPDSHQLPAGLDHLTTDVKRFMELDVDSRRGLPWVVVQAEAADVLTARMEQIRALDFDGDTLIDTPFGPRPAKAALSLRAFDAWAHEQDIRDAIRQPGGMESVAAGVAIARCAAALPTIAAAAGLSETEAVTIEVPDGRFAFAASSNPSAVSTTRLRMDARTFTRLCCGRNSAARESVQISGDTALGQRFLDRMAITP